MSKYTSIAVLGAGYVGGPIIKALVNRNASVLALTRTESNSKPDLPEGVKLERVKYSDIATVTRLLRDNHVQVVISTLSADAAGLASQNSVAEASKGAGVKLFLPSEFGMPTEGSKLGLFESKDKSAKYIQALGIPTSRIYNGFYYEMIPDLVGLQANGKINLLKGLQGKTPISFTSLEDAAGFVAYVLTTLPPAHLDYSTFRIEGQSASFVEIASILGVSVEHVEEVPAPHFTIAGFFQKYFETGGGTTGWDPAAGKEGKEKSGSSNSLWENHRWKTLGEVLTKK